MATLKATVMDRIFDVEVSSNGYFSVNVGGQAFGAYTLAELEEKVRKELREKRTEVAVPVTVIRGRTPENVVLRCFSLKDNNDILAKTIDGKKTDPVRSNTPCYKPFTEAETETFIQLGKAYADAQAKLDQFLRDRYYTGGKWGYNSSARDVLKAAIEEKEKQHA